MLNIGDIVIGTGVYDDNNLTGKKGIIVDNTGSMKNPYRVNFGDFQWWCPENVLKKKKINDLKHLIIKE